MRPFFLLEDAVVLGGIARDKFFWEWEGELLTLSSFFFRARIFYCVVAFFFIVFFVFVGPFSLPRGLDFLLTSPHVGFFVSFGLFVCGFFYSAFVFACFLGVGLA
jgi:hypothetical protein